MTGGEQDRRALDACRLLNVLVADLVASRRVYSWIENSCTSGAMRPESESARALRRMAYGSALLAACKVAEVLDEYSAVVPREQRKHLLSQLRKRRPEALRNKYFAHVLDRSTGRPIAAEEMEKALVSLGRPEEFWCWIYQPGESGGNLSKEVQDLRDTIMARYGFTRRELFARDEEG